MVPRAGGAKNPCVSPLLGLPRDVEFTFFEDQYHHLGGGLGGHPRGRRERFLNPAAAAAERLSHV